MMARATRQFKKPDRRLPFMLTKATHAQVVEAVLSEGYGGKGKSLWIREAVIEFLKDEPTAAEILESGTRTDALLDDTTLLAGPADFFSALDAKELSIRKDLPYGIDPRCKGLLIRAAMQFRLKNPKRFDHLVQKMMKPAAKLVGANPV